MQTQTPEPKFQMHDLVETAKGARFWGRIIAFDDDKNSPGCTVLAVDPDFAGTKHVYPLKQLRHKDFDDNSDRIKVMTAALHKIARWFGEFPPSGRWWDPRAQRYVTEPVEGQAEQSFVSMYGTNGERDYMRKVAQDALDGKAS